MSGLHIMAISPIVVETFQLAKTQNVTKKCGGGRGKNQEITKDSSSGDHQCLYKVSWQTTYDG